MRQHFVTFYSPGTVVSEMDIKPIDGWVIDEAMEMARGIKQRHGAVPYGFKFTTRERGPEDLDSYELSSSGMYFLGGKVETLEEIKARNLPDESILRDNMERNGWDQVITNTNSWRITLPLGDDDVVLPWEQNDGE